MTLPTRTELDAETMQAIVRRVVDVADAEKIVLFGSAGRGEMGPHSDVDLLVVVNGDCHRRRLANAIRRELRDIREAFDVVVATRRDVERYGDSFAAVYYPALREGRVIYDSAA